ncbi:MAG: sulfotransferase family protein [Desulfovermiculus sp.]
MSRKNALSIIIIGAPRSGTNMLRDVLTSLPEVATWPCDEINYIWRHGNVRYPSDEFLPEMARPEVCKYIRKKFDWVARKYRAQAVVEKTCANSLRVGFVDQAVPEAKYIFIRRDGLDAVGSAIKRWKAKLDIPYLARKVRFVPVADLPCYAGGYLWNRVHRVLSREKRLAFWGPKLNNMDELLARLSLEEVCAVQWKRCVESAAQAFSYISDDRWIEVGYEDFVRDPQSKLQTIVDFSGLEVSPEALSVAVAHVSSQSIGKGRKALNRRTTEQLMPLIQHTMASYGYVI